MKLNTNEHAKFMYKKKLIKNVKKLIKGITYRKSTIFANKIKQKVFNSINKK